MSPSPSAPTPPTVLLIDLDGTVLGQLGCVTCEYALLRNLGAKGGRLPRARAAPAAAREALISRLRYGIIRPQFDRFVKAMVHAGGVEMYVFTASSEEWAAHIVPCIEAALDVKFNRPLFTRKHCVSDIVTGTYKKSIAKVMPLVCASLKRSRKYGSLTPTQLLSAGRVALIDNTAEVGFRDEDVARTIRCPTYAYEYCYDVLQHVDVVTLHRAVPVIIEHLTVEGLYPTTQMTPFVRPPTEAPPAEPGVQQVLARYYLRLARRVRAGLPSNDRALDDKFWLRLLAALREGRNIGSSASPLRIAQLNAAVRS